MINCNNLPEDENLYHINPTTTKHQQNTGRSMYSRHHPFVSSSSSSWPLSVGPTTPRRRRRRLNASSSTLTILLLPSYILAASNRALLTLLIWGCFCAVMATLPETAVATASKYETAYACEGKTLTIECEPGDLINLIRANYGRFSITICNDHGNVDWSVNCMSAKSLRVLHTKCANKQNCSVLASTNMFGDPCPGTHKYLEAHYQCISATQTSTTTNRPSPPWLITSQPSVWSTSTVRVPTTTRFNVHDVPTVLMNGNQTLPKTSLDKSVLHQHQQHKTKKPNTIHPQQQSTVSSAAADSAYSSAIPPSTTYMAASASSSSAVIGGSNEAQPIDTKSNRNNEEGISETDITNQLDESPTSFATQQPSVLLNHNTDNYFCGPKTARNLFWNTTRVGEVNVQPCPGGATGIAKWRCVFARSTESGTEQAFEKELDSERNTDNQLDSQPNGRSNNHIVGTASTTTPVTVSSSHPNRTASSVPHRAVTWQPATPDLTYCRSLWLNSLEVRVNQRDSSLISIANDLSQVTSSKTLYGGDMLVTTKIIQTMSEKMTYDIETFPDQRQRENIVLELLNGVVRTGSNLLDATQNLSWLDLSFEDQMRVATSLLTGIEDNAFLLADTIIREWNVVQKAKNILLSVRVLETRNIIGNEIFPDVNYEQWHVSDDRIELPRGALIENSEGGLVRIVFVAFDRLEAILKPAATAQFNGAATSTGGVFPSGGLSATSFTSSSSALSSYSDAAAPSLSQSSSGDYKPIDSNKSVMTPVVRQRVLNSKVISASLGKGRHIQLSQPIRLVLKHLKTENVTNPSCVFWNYIDHAWSEDGCFVDRTNRTHTICMCNHLTNFAILMDVVDESIAGSILGALFTDDVLLRLIYGSAIGCVLLIAVALLVLRFFHGTFIKHSNRTTITKHLYTSALVLQLLFIIGISLPDTSWMCGFTAAFLHCAFLCVVAWVFVEAFQIYVTLTTEEILLEVEKSSKLIWYYLLTYGLSLTVVAISLAIDPAAYTQSDFGVWMEPAGLFYCTFVTPIFIFLLATIVYSVLSASILCRKNRTSLKTKEHVRLASVGFYVRCSCVFLVLLVACWTLCYAFMNAVKSEAPNANVLGYLFAIFNLGQGACLLTCHCLHNDKIRYAYSNFVQRQWWWPKCMRCSQQQQQPQQQQQQQQPQLQTTGGGAPSGIGETMSKASGNYGSPHSATALRSHHRGMMDDTISDSTNIQQHQQHTMTAGGGGGATSTTKAGRLYNTKNQLGLIGVGMGGGNSGNVVVVERDGCVRQLDDQTSPTSSAGSTNLIYKTNGKHHQTLESQPDWSYQPTLQQQQQQQPAVCGSQSLLHPANHHYHHHISIKHPSNAIDYRKNSMSSLSSTSSPSPRQVQRQATSTAHSNNIAPKEYFYWTEKRSSAGRRNHPNRTAAAAMSQATANQHIIRSDTMNSIYPSYRKNPTHYSVALNHDPEDEIFDDTHPGSYLARYDQQRHCGGGGGELYDIHLSNNHQHHMLQQQPLNVSHSRSGGGSPPPLGEIEHLQMLLQNQTTTNLTHNNRGNGGLAAPNSAGNFYNQYQSAAAGYAIEEPVYEEIMSNRGSRVEADEDAAQQTSPHSNHIRQSNSNRPQLMGSSYAFQSPNHLHSSALSGAVLPSSLPDQQQQQFAGQQQQQLASNSKSVGRNLSAMLDENNTVVCYLEPMANQ